MKYIILPILKFIWAIILTLFTIIYYWIYILGFIVWNLRFIDDELEFYFKNTTISINISPYYESKYYESHFFDTYIHYIWGLKH